MWKELASDTNLILERYDSMDMHLSDTVTGHLQPIIMSKESPYDKLKALSAWFTKNPYVMGFSYEPMRYDVWLAASTTTYEP